MRQITKVYKNFEWGDKVPSFIKILKDELKFYHFGFDSDNTLSKSTLFVAKMIMKNRRKLYI